MIDLHSHSVFSDGSETPERVMELAATAGCSGVALTDHDGLGGVEAARAAAEALGMRFVPGCEVSCVFSPGSMHVLCYFIEPGDGPLQDELGHLREDRNQRNEQLIDSLNTIGIPISMDEVDAEAKGTTVGRPHFAAVLVKKGVVRSFDEAFDRYLAKGGAAYVRKARIRPSDIIERTTASGGVAVVAHPLSLGLTMKGLEKEVAELAEQGLGGLECYYGRYDERTRRELVAIAKRHGLVATGGSDFHGAYKPDLSMGSGTGDLRVPDAVIDELIEKRNVVAGDGRFR